MVDIFLIQPPVRDFYLTAKRTIPYGLTCIAASAIQAGFTVDIFDGLASGKSKILNWPPEFEYLKAYYGKPDLSPFSLFHHYRHFGYSFDYIGQLAKASGAFLVGISSLFTAYRNEAIATAEIVKKYHPDCRIVVGGHHPTAMPEDVLQHPAVDFVLQGEGEVSLPMLANAIKFERQISNIPGIVFRNPDGTIFKTEPAAIKNLDDQPLPEAALINQSFYQRRKKQSAVIVGSRGCPMACSYCAVGSSPNIPYRQRSVASVMAEIDRAMDHNDVGFIDFEDENLSLNKSWFLRLLTRITDRYGRDAIELRAMNGLFPGSLDEELICAMKAAGFKILNLSLGSISSRQLRRFNRKDISESISRVLDLADKYNMESVAYVIAAAPDQSAEDSVQDLLYIASKKALAGLSIFYPSPGSNDFERCKSLGILPGKLSLMRSSTLPLSHTTSRLEAVTLLRLARILNFIKALTHEERRSLASLPVSPSSYLNLKNRKAIGMQLLSWFLFDGSIRGVMPDGKIYQHLISKRLATAFLKGVTI